MTDKEKTGLMVLLRAAAAHGEATNAFVESSDLQGLLTTAWGMMDEEKRRVFVHSTRAQGLIAAWAGERDRRAVIDHYGEPELDEAMRGILDRLQAAGDPDALTGLMQDAHSDRAFKVGEEGPGSQVQALVSLGWTPEAIGKAAQAGRLEGAVLEAYHALADRVSGEGFESQLRALRRVGYTAEDIEPYLEADGLGPTP